MTCTRRQFLGAMAASAASTLPAVLAAQGAPAGTASAPMDQNRYVPIDRPVKGPPVLSDAERDALEHRLHCQCGCNLDVYTCRTTDFTCQVSPAMHRDVLALVEGGYDAQEILDAFVETYGEKALMAPRKQGFNLAGWLAPFAALATGLGVVVAVLRRWHRAAEAAGPAEPVALDATPEELARVDALLRSDDR